jgi:hypothetical protein
VRGLAAAAHCRIARGAAALPAGHRRGRDAARGARGVRLRAVRLPELAPLADAAHLLCSSKFAGSVCTASSLGLCKM